MEYKDNLCNYTIHRHRKSSKVISVSLWKKNPGYIFNLSNSVLWWSRNVEMFFPDWNIRMFIDKNTFSYMKNDIDNWEDIFLNLRKKKNVELWIYNNNIGTFGSLVRYQPFTDSDVDVCVVRNIELLFSPKEARIIHWWDKSDYKYLSTLDLDGYSCNYGNLKLCSDNDLLGTNMIVSYFFGYKGTDKNFFNNLYSLVFNKKLEKYPYGIDEIYLCKQLKKQMTFKNTFIFPRFTYTGMLIIKPLSSDIYNKFKTIIIMILKSLNLLDDFSNDVQIKYKYDNITLDVYPLETIINLHRDIKTQTKPIDSIEKKVVEQYALENSEMIFKYFKNNLLQTEKYLINVSNNMKNVKNFPCITTFKKIKSNSDIDCILDFSILEQFMSNYVNTRDVELYVHSLLLYSVIEGLDVQGINIKSKTEKWIPYHSRLTEYEKKRQYEIRLNSILKNPRMYPNKEKAIEILNKDFEENIEREYQEKIKKTKKLNNIFLENIKNIYLTDDKFYY